MAPVVYRGEGGGKPPTTIFVKRDVSSPCDFIHGIVHVPGDTGVQVPGRVPVHRDDDNGADSQPYPCLYQQLRQPVSIRLPQR